MEFSDVYQQTNGCVTFSPNGKHVAYRVEHRVIVRTVGLVVDISKFQPYL